MENGTPGRQKLSKAQIEILDAVGFQWKLKSHFDKRIDELMAFKAKFRHCNVAASNKLYTSLGLWCNRIRESRRLIEKGMPGKLKLSKAQIERLDALGFLWGGNKSFVARV